jgi:hypothetical protein
MSIVRTHAHGIIDFLNGVLLILAPYLFAFSTGGIDQ